MRPYVPPERRIRPTLPKAGRSLLFLAALCLSSAAIVLMAGPGPRWTSARGSAALVCRLDVDTGHGSCVPVGCVREGDGWRLFVLTAKHVTEGASIIVLMPEDGNPSAGGTAVDSPDGQDLSIVSFHVAERRDVVPLREEPLSLLDEVTAVGFGGDNGLRWASRGLMSGGDRMTAPVWPGDSGGAVLDSSGRLAGIADSIEINFSPQLQQPIGVPHEAHMELIGPSTARWVRQTVGR